MHRFALKPEIYYAEAALDCLKIDSVKKLFIVIDPMMMENGYGKKIEEVYSGRQDMIFTYFTNVKPDPSLELIIDGVKAIMDCNPDMIVAVGGGSTIDAAKTIVFLYDKIQDQLDASFKKPIFAVIPTTSGTGSEVTNFSVVTIDGRKCVLVDDGFFPDIAVIDVEFTKTLPAAILADTAIDALTHALEAYVSKNESDCTDALAEKSIKLIFKHLKKIFISGDNIESRRHLHNASCLAGISFSNASLGINHSMAHALGAAFHIPHGKANAVFLTKTLSFNKQVEYVQQKIYGLCKEMGLPGDTPEECFEVFLAELESLLRICNMPVYVKDLNIELDLYLKEIFDLSQKAMEDRCTLTNPVTPVQDDLIRLFIRAYE